MLVSEDRGFIEKARFLSQQARDPAPHYEHSQIGYNYRMSNIVAAIGLGQLRCLEERVRRKREIFEYYHKALADLPGIEFMPEAPYGRGNRWLTVILVDPELFGADRETIRLALEKENIESRPVWKPMHLQSAFIVDADIALFKTGQNGRGRYPARTVGGHVSEMLFQRGLCLPSGTAMSDHDLNRITDIIGELHLLGAKRSA
jgi:dTDP-4-amino-4,6-dideoxygalactose transaminase